MTDRPAKFQRGVSFVHTFTIPPEYIDGHFSSWLPLAQVRCKGNTLPAGLVTHLDCAWEDKLIARKIGVRVTDTENWPIDTIHVDVLLTSPSGECFRTDPLVLEVVPGVSVVVP